MCKINKLKFNSCLEAVLFHSKTILCSFEANENNFRLIILLIVHNKRL